MNAIIDAFHDYLRYGQIINFAAFEQACLPVTSKYYPLLQEYRRVMDMRKDKDDNS